MRCLDELEKIKSDIVEIKLEIKPLERLPDKLDELIRLQQEFIQILTQNYTSEKVCIERRKTTEDKVDRLEALVGNILKGIGTVVISALGYLLSQVLHK